MTSRLRMVSQRGSVMFTAFDFTWYTKNPLLAKEARSRAPSISILSVTGQSLLQRYFECDVDAGVRWIAEVIHAVNLHYINVLRVEPVAGPSTNKSERVAAVLEAVIAVIAFADPKAVFPPKIGLVTVFGNAAATVTSALRRLCAFLFLLVVLILGLRILLFLCTFLLWLSFLFFLLILLLLLCIHWRDDSE